MLEVDFFKKSVLLWIGNLIFSFLGVIVFYLLANTLGPAEYGNYSLVLSIVAMLSLAFYGIIGEAIVRFSSESKDKVLYHGLRLKLIFGILAFFILFIFAGKIAQLYAKPLAVVIRVVAFIFLFTPFIEAVKSQSIGSKGVKGFVLLSSIFQISLIISLMLFFILGKTGLYASLAFLVAHFVTFLVSLRYIKFKLLFRKSKARIVSRMNKYIKNGFLYGLTKNIYFQSPFIVGGYFVDSVNLAFYSFGLSLGTQGLFTFITAIQTMLLPYVVGIKEESKRSEYIGVVIKIGIIVTVILSLIILLLVYFLLPVLFPKYIDSFKYMPWVFLAFIFLNLRAPMALFKVAERTDILTKISIFTSIASVIFGMIMSFFFGLVGIIITLNVSVLLSSYLHIYYLKKIGNIKIDLSLNKSDWFIFKHYLSLFFKSIKKKYF